MFIKEKEDIFEMDNDGKKSFFKSGRFLLTGLASAVLATAAVNLVSLDSNSANADDVKVSYASGIVSWKANDQETIQRNMLNQGITGIDQLSNYKVVWGDTLSGIAQHFGTTVESIAFKFGITNPNFIVAGVTVENQHLLVTNETVSVPSTATQVTDFFAPSVNKNSQSYNSSTTSNSAGKTDNSKASQSVNASSSSKASDNDTNIGGASDVINGQTGVSIPAASATPVAKPSESTPAGNTSVVAPAPTAPVASSTNNDTNIGGASDVINGQTDSSSPVVSSTPATKPSESAPVNSSAVASVPKAPVASSSHNDDTNIGGASDVINGQTDSSSPVVSATPAAKLSESAPADNTSTVAPTPAAPVASSTNDDTNIGGASEVINGQTDSSSPATDQAAADKAAAAKAAADKAAADQAAADKAAADQAAADKAAAEQAAADKAAADKAAADKAAADKSAADKAAADKAAADKAAADQAADQAAVSANGKNTNYYGSVEPSHPQEGDTWFWVNGDKSGIKVFVNGDWVALVDSDTQEKISAGVTEAVAQAKAATEQAAAQAKAATEQAAAQAKAAADKAAAEQAAANQPSSGYSITVNSDGTYINGNYIGSGSSGYSITDNSDGTYINGNYIGSGSSGYSITANSDGTYIGSASNVMRSIIGE